MKFESLFDIPCIQDTINKYLDYEDMGVYFTSKSMYSKIYKPDFEKKKKEYEDKVLFTPWEVPNQLKFVTSRILDSIFERKFIHILRKIQMESKLRDMREYILKLADKHNYVVDYISSHDVWYIHDIYLKCITSSHFNIRYILNHYYPKIGEIYELMVKKSGITLQFVQNHSVPNISEIYKNSSSSKWIKSSIC
jgi:hypothetical protein